MVWGWFRGKKDEAAPAPDPGRAAILFAKVASDKKPPPTLPTSPVPGTPAANAELDPKNRMFPSALIQKPDANQKAALPQGRAMSSIPKSDYTPSHQPENTSRWIYPSEQMFYNAMKRKGWNPNEEDMAGVVAIHNAVNERCWREILAWEELHASTCGRPTLTKFMGRPKDITPKARLLNSFGYKLPFDRHDWIVDRCGTEVRYVIDFYNAAPVPGSPIAMHLDVRPALDTPGALFDRLYMQFRWMGSGRWMGEGQTKPPDGSAQPS